MANQKQVSQVVFESIQLITRCRPEALTPQTRLISDLNIESIDIVDILFEIEKHLGVSLNLADVFQNKRRTSGQKDQFDLQISDIVDYIVNLDLK